MALNTLWQSMLRNTLQTLYTNSLHQVNQTQPQFSWLAVPSFPYVCNKVLAVLVELMLRFLEVGCSNGAGSWPLTLRRNTMSVCVSWWCSNLPPRSWHPTNTSVSFFVEAEKCDFYVFTVFLSHWLTKVKAITEWPTPTSLKQRLLGFASFKSCSHIAATLTTHMSYSDVWAPWSWNGISRSRMSLYLF